MVLAEGWIMENYLGWPCLLCLSRWQVCSVEVRDRTVVVKKFWQKIKAVQKPREKLLRVRLVQQLSFKSLILILLFLFLFLPDKRRQCFIKLDLNAVLKMYRVKSLEVVIEDRLEVPAL